MKKSIKIVMLMIKILIVSIPTATTIPKNLNKKSHNDPHSWCHDCDHVRDKVIMIVIK